jgi:hypothetical protein
MYSTIPQESRPTRRKMQKRLDNYLWTCWKKNKTYQPRDPPSTSRISAAIIAGEFTNARSKRGTWCYTSNSRSPTSYPRLGKDPSSSAKLY